MSIRKIMNATLGVTLIGLFTASMIFTHIPIAGKFTVDYASNLTHDAYAALVDRRIPKIVNLGPDTCSGYAVRTADLYGFEYGIHLNGNKNVEGSAWDLAGIPTNNTVWKGSAASLDDLTAQLSASGQELRVGDIIAMYNPLSPHNEPGREYTHMATYIGNGMIAQENVTTLKSNLDNYLDYSSQLAQDLGIGGRFMIKAVLRASPGDNNDIMLSPFVIPGFYRSVAEPWR
jgi:hypothetical protein